MHFQIRRRVILLLQVVFQSSIFLPGHLQYVSSLKQWLLDNKKLQFSTLCSVVSQLKKESGATQIQDSKFDKFYVKMKQSINRQVNSGVIIFVFASEPTFYFSDSNYYTGNFGFYTPSQSTSKYRVWDLIYMFGSLELSTNQLSFDESDNSIYFPTSGTSATVITPSSTDIFINQGALH